MSYQRSSYTAQRSAFILPPTSCREHIGLVLTSRISVIDDLLETVGVGHVLGIEAIPRRVVDDSDKEEEVVVVITPDGTST